MNRKSSINTTTAELIKTGDSYEQGKLKLSTTTAKFMNSGDIYFSKCQKIATVSIFPYMASLANRMVQY